jgi:hypothetical protein
MANSSLSRTQGGISGSAGRNVAPDYKEQGNKKNSFIDEIKKTARYLVTPRTYRDGSKKPGGGV